MKHTYEEPELDVILLPMIDVITTSGDDDEGDPMPL